MKEYLPAKMIDPFVALSGINHEKLSHQITAPEREIIIELLKAMRFNIKFLCWQE